MCPFSTIEDAVNTVIVTIQSGVPVARIELLDELTMDACIRYSKLEGYEAAPTLFFEFHGSEANVAEQAETVRAIARDCGGAEFQWTARAEERSRLWQARHDAFWATSRCAPGPRHRDRRMRADLAPRRMHHRGPSGTSPRPGCSRRWSVTSATATSI